MSDRVDFEIDVGPSLRGEVGRSTDVDADTSVARVRYPPGGVPTFRMKEHKTGERQDALLMGSGPLATRWKVQPHAVRVFCDRLGVVTEVATGPFDLGKRRHGVLLIR